MIGFDDRGVFDQDDLAPARGIFLWAAISMVVILFLVLARCAMAQNQPSSCSSTVGGTAANITFGHSPSQYVIVCNPSSSATLWISTTTTAAANASGSIGLPVAASAATSCMTLPAMPTISIIASAGSTPYTCFYR